MKPEREGHFISFLAAPITILLQSASLSVLLLFGLFVGSGLNDTVHFSILCPYTSTPIALQRSVEASSHA